VSVELTSDEVMKGSVFLSGLALMPVLHFREAHARSHVLRLDAVDHPLVESVTRVCG
jgi:hypothetical protein